METLRNAIQAFKKNVKDRQLFKKKAKKFQTSFPSNGRVSDNSGYSMSKGAYTPPQSPRELTCITGDYIPSRPAFVPVMKSITK